MTRTPILTLFALLAACDLVDDTKHDTNEEADTDTDTDTDVDEASVRYINMDRLRDPVTFEASAGGSVSSVDVGMVDGTDYIAYAVGAYDVEAYSDGSTSSFNSWDLTLAADEHYTVHVLRGGSMSVSKDDLSGIGSDEVSVRLWNDGLAGGDLWVGYFDGSGYVSTVSEQGITENHQGTYLLDVPSDKVQWEMVWDLPDSGLELLVDFQVADNLQDNAGGIAHLYPYFDGDCSYESYMATGNIACESKMAVHSMDGTVSIVDGEWGWTGTLLPTEGTWVVTEVDTISAKCGGGFVSSPDQVPALELTLNSDSSFIFSDGVDIPFDCSISVASLTCNDDTKEKWE
ncbi:MAG: hypothetical protein ACI8S6_004983, partial [Myxococcota bacterium]